MNNILGLDPSLTNSGYCYRDTRGEGGVKTGVITTKKLKGVCRLKSIEDSLSMVLKLRSINFVVCEGYSMGSRGGRIFDIGELGGVIKIHCYNKKIPMLIVPPASLKIFITGKGNADKKEMINSIERDFNVSFTNDNEADAFGLMVLGEYYRDNDRLRGTSNRVRALQGCMLLNEFTY